MRDLLHNVGNPDASAYPTLLATELNELMHGLASDEERAQTAAALALGVIGTRHDTAVFWTQLLDHLPAMRSDPAGNPSSTQPGTPGPQHGATMTTHGGRTHPLDLISQALGRSRMQQPDLWRALVARVRACQGGAAGQRTLALAQNMALAGVRDPSTWGALVDCVVQQSDHQPDPHGPEVHPAHAARLALAKRFAAAGITSGPAWAALIRDALPMSDAQRDELLGVLYEANPSVTTLCAVAGALPTAASLLRHIMSRAAGLKPAQLWAMVQFAQATQQMHELTQALADMDDAARQACASALEGALKAPRQTIGLPGAQHEDWHPHPTIAWTELLRWLSLTPQTRGLVGGLALALTTQSGWATVDRLRTLVAALGASGARASVWATVIHRLPEPGIRHLVLLAQAMRDAGVSGKVAWRELQTRALDLKRGPLQDLIAALGTIPATDDPALQAAASMLGALTGALARQADLLTQAHAMSAAQWAAGQDALLAELIADTPISFPRVRSLAKLLMQRGVTDPRAWARLLRNVPNDSFNRSMRMIDLVGDYLARTGLAMNPDVAPQVERMLATVELLATRKSTFELEQHLGAMRQTLSGRPYAACMRELLRKAIHEDMDTLMDLVADICGRAPAMVLSFWRGYMTVVMSFKDIGLMARCLLQARRLMTLHGKVPGEFTAARLQLEMLESLLEALLDKQKKYLDTTDYIIVMEAMDPATKAPAIRRMIEEFLRSAPAPDLQMGEASKLFARSIAVFRSVAGPGARTTLDCVRWWVDAGHFDGVVNRIGKDPGVLDGPITRLLCGRARNSKAVTTRWLNCVGGYLRSRDRGPHTRAVEQELLPYLTGLLVELPPDTIATSTMLQWLGPRNLLGMVTSVGRLDAPGPYTVVFSAMMRNIATTGRLQLDSITAVQHHRKMLRTRAPHIQWDCVFHPAMHPDMPVLTVQTAGASARQATLAVLNALHALTLSLLAWAKDESARPGPGDNRHTALHRSREPMLVHQCLKPLLCLVGKRGTRTATAAAANLWGPLWEHGGGLQVTIDRNTVITLCADEFYALCQDLIFALEHLPDGAGAPLKAQAELVKALAGHLRTLDHLPGTGTMNLSASYRVALRDPEDPASLLHCQTTGGCLQPGNEHFPHMLERLAGWIVWTAVDDNGITCAAAWGTLNERCELVIDFVDASRNGPAEGTSEMVQALLDYGPIIKTHLGITGPIWVGPPQYGRLTDLDVFKRPKMSRTFSSLTPSLAHSAREAEQPPGTPPRTDKADPDYTDSLNKGRLPYFQL